MAKANNMILPTAVTLVMNELEDDVTMAMMTV